MEGEIVSKEDIKPSSPTPPHLQIHNLSLLDQIVPPFYTPIVLHYPNLLQNNTFSQSAQLQLLKQSLSSTLTRYYPLAGTIRDNLSIDCNDQGVLFVVTKFQTNLTHSLKKPNPNADKAHLPSEYLTWNEPGPGDKVAIVQVNRYACGGIVLGCLVYHRVADGVSMSAFVKDWAATARADSRPGPDPTFDFHSIFPHNPALKRDSDLTAVLRRYFRLGRPVLRRYVFDQAAISGLRAQTASTQNERTSRVEIVTAVMWKFFMAACAAVDGTKTSPKTSVISHSLNLRRKAEPQFQENSFGNLTWIGLATSPNEEPDRDVEKLLGKVRGALRKLGPGFMKRMEGEEGLSGYEKNVEGTWGEFPEEEADYLLVSSWCNLGMYGADFGWGRPVWVTKCVPEAEVDMEVQHLNAMWLMDTREGDGVELRLSLDRKYSEALDGIDELRQLAKIEPSPLDMAGIVVEY